MSCSLNLIMQGIMICHVITNHNKTNRLHSSDNSCKVVNIEMLHTYPYSSFMHGWKYHSVSMARQVASLMQCGRSIRGKQYPHFIHISAPYSRRVNLLTTLQCLQSKHPTAGRCLTRPHWDVSYGCSWWGPFWRIFAVATIIQGGEG